MMTNYKTLEGIADSHAANILNQLHNDNYQLHQLVQNVAAAIYTCDADGVITFYNKAAADLWGREPELGKDLWCGSWKIYYPESGARMSLDECPMAETLKRRKSSHGEVIWVERPDGRRRFVAPFPDPLFDEAGNMFGAVNLLVDITELKEKEYALRESETKLKQLAHELEIHVEQRTKDLKEANAALLRTNAELEQFAFVASHDMQEPLRKIKTFTSRLERTNKAKIDEEGLRMLEKIKTSASKMETLIRDVLHYSRAAGHVENFSPIDLNAVFKDAVDELELRIEQQRATITATELPVINAIPHQMNQLFSNLMENSLKFCRVEEPCRLEIATTLLTDSQAEALNLNPALSYCDITFKDNGIGFGQQYAEHVFNIFERLHRDEQYSGTGIGLALCRKIVTLHQGTIFARSIENEGTSIHVILPYIRLNH